MAGLDDISEAIGQMRADIGYVKTALTGDRGLVSRVETLERDRAADIGRASAVGALGGATAGAGIVATWKLIAAKVGLGE